MQSHGPDLAKPPADPAKNRAVAAPIELLRRVVLFEELDDVELQALAESMVERTFPAGESVTSEGGGGDGFFLVESGEASVAADGAQRGALGPGDHFGEIALMIGSERTATITATTELRCHGLDATSFRDVVEGNPSIAWKLSESMMNRLS
jgi:CRP/FNR family cyclic AMP-dependent transcriptional regulator